MTTSKKTNALDYIQNTYGQYPEFKAGVEQARENLTIGQIIYDARQEAGLTQSELAKLAGTTQSVISRLEDADYEGYSLPLLNRIAVALHKQIDIRFVPESSKQSQPAL